MRMRRKKWAEPELTACPYFMPYPERTRGAWRGKFAKDQPLHLELGCGKGVSTAKMIADNLGVNFMAMDINTDVLGVARRNIASEMGGREPDNVLLLRGNIEQIEYFFAPEDRVERIYINFCNPWNQRAKQHKKRLTHTRQLMKYRDFLADEGEIWFKTDDDALFLASRRYFAEAGFTVRYITYDLHADGFTPNYVSEHEALYLSQGVPIKFLIAVKGDIPSKTPGVFEGECGLCEAKASRPSPHAD